MIGAVLLAAVALAAGGKPVTVGIDGTGYLSGNAVVGSDRLTLTAPAYRLAIRGGAVGVFLLLHETGHTSGIENECTADEYGLAHMRTAYRRFWPRLTGRQIAGRIATARRYRDDARGSYCP